jgi:hypothetical protein
MSPYILIAWPRYEQELLGFEEELGASLAMMAVVVRERAREDNVRN